MEDHRQYVQAMGKEQTDKNARTLEPVNDDPRFRGVFIVPAYREYRLLVLRVDKETNGTKRPAGK